MKIEDKNTKASGKSIAVVIILGMIDVLAAALLIFALVFHPEEGEAVKTDLPKEFESNADTYYDYGREKKYTSAATVSFQSEQGATQKEDPVKQEELAGTGTEKYSRFVFPDSDTELLTDAQIQNKVLDDATCRRAINEIYARHGYEFTKQENIDYFNTYDWYKNMTKEPDMTVVSSRFSAVEKSNVEKLQAYEDSKGWS